MPNAPLKLKVDYPVQVILLHSDQLGGGIMAKVRVGESGGGSDDDSQGGQKPGRQAPMSMTSRVGRNQMVGNVLDYQVYSSPKLTLVTKNPHRPRVLARPNRY